MAPDLALLVLVAAYTALTLYDTISTWSIERKSRRKVAPRRPDARWGVLGQGLEGMSYNLTTMSGGMIWPMGRSN